MSTTVINIALKHWLKANGYWNIKILNGKICALERFIFTTGLVVGLDEFGKQGRYCYEDKASAEAAIEEWDGIGDPPGPWIKYKGKGGERLNEKYFKGEEVL